ncbi:MAG: DNA primase [Ignavibacteria bacterium]|nr:DNA primase [Ignavibacteria bacterium]
MRIPESKIEEVRTSASVVDVVSEFVQLRKRGKNYIGLCPFHNEKTPSFTVSEEKQIFHCFGCHTGGNVFKFLMEFQKISFVESVQQLAEQLGITIDYEQTGYLEHQTEQEIYYDINTETAKYFSNLLLNDDEGKFAREYFQKRNIKTQTMRTFGLGYALRGWENFINFSKEKGFDEDKIVALGLVGRNKEGRVYDKFSGRIIFPIFSPNGRVVAFAGRILDDKEKSAKYLNSPESLVYIKGRTLYGLSHAKDDIRKLDKAILVEGYMDLISLYQNGVKNVVAVSGTALTDDQVQLLSRYTKNVVLLFDSDTAGIKASMRSIELLLKRDMEVKIVSLPEGEDPDSFINKYGKDEFDELIKKAENFLEYQTRYYDSLGKFDDPATAAEAIRELVKPVALINDELKQTLLLKNIAKKFNIREKLLESELIKQVNQVEKFERNKTKIKTKNDSTTSTLALSESRIESPVIYNLETEIIKLLFESDKNIKEFLFNYIQPDEFAEGFHQKILRILKNEFQKDENVTADLVFANLQDEQLETYVREITFDKHSISSNWDNRFPGMTDEMIVLKYAKDIVLRFRIEKIDEQILTNHRELELIEDEEAHLNFMRTNKELEEEKKRLREELSDKELT